MGDFPKCHPSSNLTLELLVGHSLVKAPSVLDVTDIVRQDFWVGIQRYLKYIVHSIDHLSLSYFSNTVLDL